MRKTLLNEFFDVTHSIHVIRIYLVWRNGREIVDTITKKNVQKGTTETCSINDILDNDWPYTIQSLSPIYNHICITFQLNKPTTPLMGVAHRNPFLIILKKRKTRPPLFGIRWSNFVFKVYTPNYVNIDRSGRVRSGIPTDFSSQHVHAKKTMFFRWKAH